MLKSYGIGGRRLGAQIVFRNVLDNKPSLIRRYIRIIFKLLDNRFILEWRAGNCI